MNITRKAINRSLLIVLFCFSTDALGQEQHERAALVEQVQAAREKVTELKREQDYLIFQQEMYASDSKYLVLNMTTRSGELRYKNRVLKDFRFVPAQNFQKDAVPPGMATLTKKITGKNKCYALIFGTTLVVRWTWADGLREGANIPALLLKEKDILSACAAVEEGAPAYIIP